MRTNLLSLLLPALLWSQDDIATFRTSVSVVKVDAMVTNAKGETIGDLDKSDFRVYDENQPREIVEFKRETEPLHLLLVLDVSGSMSRVLGEMSEKATEALRQLRPGDRVSLMVFAEKHELLQPFTTETGKIAELITNSVFKSQWGRGTVYNDTLIAAAKQFDGPTVKGRRSILLVSDGAGIRGSASDAQVLRALQDLDIVLNAILVGSAEPKASRQGYSDPSGALPGIADFVRSTGGETLQGADVAALLKKTVAGIATRYSLEYPAPRGEPGKFRSIRVDLSPEARLKHPGAAIKSRTGYYVDGQ